MRYTASVKKEKIKQKQGEKKNKLRKKQEETYNDMALGNEK